MGVFAVLTAAMDAMGSATAGVMMEPETIPRFAIKFTEGIEGVPMIGETSPHLENFSLRGWMP
jgi:hypothetical protein